MASTSMIPLIDLRPWTQSHSFSESERLQVAEKIDDACRTVGFFIIQNHGVDETIMEQAWNSSRDFFDLPLERKLLSKTDNETTYPYGYENNERLVAGRNKDSTVQAADLKETFSIGPCNPDAGMPKRRFPEKPSNFQSNMEAYYEAMEDLALLLLRILAVGLKLQQDYFEPFMSRHLSALRSLNYPAIDRNQQQGDAVRIRASEHTDYGLLTILKSGGPGLQVKKDVDSSIHWIDAPVLDNAFIINIGDMMQRWTNDQWVSTLHRVVVMPDEQERRQSMAYFVNVNGDTLVRPLETCGKAKYEPISAKEHLMAKHLASMGYRPE